MLVSCTVHMEGYIMLSLLHVQVAWLDKIDRRYSWLKRALVKFDEDFQGTFPTEWHVEERISEEFCRVTKYDLGIVNFSVIDFVIKTSAVKSSSHAYSCVLYFMRKLKKIERFSIECCKIKTKPFTYQLKFSVNVKL